jgi:predicted GIY-YIG superfamily endonuclease
MTRAAIQEADRTPQQGIVSPLAEAAADAPDGAGVYCFLSANRELLYIGKALNLRRRLAQHAHDAHQPGARRAGSLYRRVSHVRWETARDDDAACAREADLIVALQPPYNAAIAGEGCWAYVIATPMAGGRLRLTVSDQMDADAGRAYGCFPHLGIGVSSRPAIACSDGYVALLRLLWIASGASGYIPRRIAAGSPPEWFDVAFDAALGGPLHAFLSGQSRALLRELSAVRTPDDPLLDRVRIRDLKTADGFFIRGAQSMRGLRLRHALPPGCVTREQFEALLAIELRASIGEFSVRR